MIRDGLTTDSKIVRRIPKKIDETYETDYLESVVRAYDLYLEAKTLEGAKYLRDPYAIALFLEPSGRVLSKIKPKLQEDGELTCKEYFDAVADNEMSRILPKMTEREYLFCNLAAHGGLGVPKYDVIGLIAKSLGLNVGETLHCWVLQDDVLAISFALASKRAILEGVTPVIGLPLNMIYPSYTTSHIRFPAVVEKIPSKSTMVHIHKDGNLFKIFDSDGKEVDLDKNIVDKLKNIPSSYVIEGFINGSDQLVIWDVLCWNDIWLYLRPLSERVNMLWRFHEWNQERFVVRNWKDLQQFEDNYVLRNTNSLYDPTKSDSHIFLTEETQTAVLRVGGAKGKKTPCLVTHDKKPLFELGVKIDREDYGDIVEVSKKGEVVQILRHGTAVDTYSEVMRKWNLPSFEEYSVYRMPKGSWPERE